MMSTSPLIDRDALLAHRRRADTADLFLHRAAMDDVQDRLAMVNREFTAPAVVTPFPDFWRDAFPAAVCVADSDTIELQPGAHDLVIHAMGLHWANDPVGQLIQCRRALREDGFFLSIAPGGQTLAQLRAVLGQAETEITGGLSPRIAPMGEIRELGALLQRAGFALPVADSIDLTASYRDIYHLMHDLRAMGETNALSHRLRRATGRAVFRRAGELYQQHFGEPDGRIPARFELVCLTGWSPSESQPKPLRPGSAQMRLADALDTTETPLPD
ncbi:SAM-dependent methyltransferase [Pontibaca sp. S1109L]|uniref:SAM-dependent methyltransferase n=2 Tax=Pontibaca salina TaxID=2795731 RepID=A0A934HLY7_9RHOB|nr:SAM-dependent methyltransferase [Pontibaca salina]